jgi:hypothetical protein
VPATPFGLNGDPSAEIELPGVNRLDGPPQVLVGAPGCPGPFGLGSAETIPTTDNPTIAKAMIYNIVLLIKL